VIAAVPVLLAYFRVNIVNVLTLLQYFNKEEQLWAADPDLKYNIGDLVLVKKLKEPLMKDVNHFVAETVFPIGNVIDPVTGRRCRGTRYLDEINRHFRKLDFAAPPDVPTKKH